MPRLEMFCQLAQLDIHVQWIVEGLISPGEWTFLVGKAGTGKSMLCIQLCAALQEGKPFMGMATTQHNCLYLQADTGLVEWQTQIKRLAPESAAFSYSMVPKSFLDNAEDRAYVADLIAGTYPRTSPFSKQLKHKPFDFVVLDCLNRISARDINARNTAIDVIDQLDDMTGDAHYVLVHHPAKGQTLDTESGAGSNVFGTRCGTHLTLTPAVLGLQKSKLIAKRDLMLERDGPTGAWQLPQW